MTPVLELSRVGKQYAGPPVTRALQDIDLRVEQGEFVAIARALVTEPSLLLADEPTGNLDSQTGVTILDLFRQLHADGSTIVLVTHDLTLAATLPRTVTIRDGSIVSDDSLAAAATSPDVVAANGQAASVSPDHEMEPSC